MTDSSTGVSPADAAFGQPELVRQIRSRIERAGPITFAQFMDLALYTPKLGYYAALQPGPEGESGALADYQTSPQVHPIFGHLLAAELIDAWQALGRPVPLVIVEPGAGAGELADQILAGLRERQPALAVIYHAVDRREHRPAGRTAPHRALPRAAGIAFHAPESAGALPALGGARSPIVPPRRAGLTWPSPPGSRGSEDGGENDSPDLEGAAASGPIWWPNLDALQLAGVRAHCIVSNELFDALPVHRLARVGGAWRESYVDWSASGAGFVERWGPLADPALLDVLGGRGRTEGWRGEVCACLPSMLRQLAALVERGIILSVDYGYGVADGRFGGPEGETLVAYHRHQWNEDLYRRVGLQDLTSHVDFAAFLRIGRRFGLEPAGALTQRDFLLRRGLPAEIARWSAREKTPGAQWQARLAMAELAQPTGLGSLKVVAQTKGGVEYRVD